MAIYRRFVRMAVLATAVSGTWVQAAGTPAQGTRPIIAYDGSGASGGATAQPPGWTQWSPRNEISPRFSVDAKVGLRGGGALKLAGNRIPGVHGGWECRADGLTAGRNYRLTVHYRTTGIADPLRSIAARIEWLDSKGRRAEPPDFAGEGVRTGDWVRVEHQTVAPPDTRSAVIRLSLTWAPEGAVWWDGIRLEETAPPKGRRIRVLTVKHRPQSTGSASASLEQFCQLIEGTAGQNPDVICLPEGVTVVGSGKVYADVAEPLPGPSTRRLGAVAQKLRSYIVAGIYERVGSLIYNTAVLIDRDGKLAGSYRKTHLPYEEVEGGITAGDSYPVFKTDFGTIGILICWDLQFPEPWRAVASRGADLVLLPIWGGSETLARARAIENNVFVVSSSYDMKTFIVDPAGNVVDEAGPGHAIAAAEIDLDRKIIQPWIGDMKTRTWKERRTDIPIR